jgi:hypothetical protein
VPADIETNPGKLGDIPVVTVNIEGIEDRGNVILYLHGGAYAIGSAASSVGLASNLGRRASSYAHISPPAKRLMRTRRQWLMNWLADSDKWTLASPAPCRVNCGRNSSADRGSRRESVHRFGRRAILVVRSTATTLARRRLDEARLDALRRDEVAERCKSPAESVAQRTVVQAMQHRVAEGQVVADLTPGPRRVLLPDVGAGVGEVPQQLLDVGAQIGGLQQDDLVGRVGEIGDARPSLLEPSNELSRHGMGRPIGDVADERRNVVAKAARYLGDRRRRVFDDVVEVRRAHQRVRSAGRGDQLGDHVDVVEIRRDTVTAGRALVSAFCVATGLCHTHRLTERPPIPTTRLA